MLKKSGKYLFILIAITILVKGCGIFETRDPEPPEEVRSNYVSPTTADLVLTNLENAIAEKNSENYIKCLSAENFQYIPDSRSLQNYKIIFTEWDQLSEKRYLDNLIINTPSTSALFLSNKRLTQVSPDSAVFQANYQVVFQHNQQNIPKTAKGNLIFNIATDANDLYYVRRWEDFRQNDTDFTWSELKANFND